MAIALRIAVSIAMAALVLAPALAAPARAGDEIVDDHAQRNPAAQPETRSANGAEPAAKFDDIDAMAALEGISIALNEVGDGGTYVWRRRDGGLSGMAQPHQSFKNTDGLACRRLTVMLSAFDRSRRIEGVACRAATGRWQLEG